MQDDIYSISLIINIKNNHLNYDLDKLLQDIAYNYNSFNNYTDYNLEGVNKYVKENSKIIIFEFVHIKDICNFISFIKNLKYRNICIEYIYHDNNILFADNKYLNNIDKYNQDKNKLIDIINNNKNNKQYSLIYNIL